MVDTTRRKALAYHLRQLSVGIISNDEFEGRIVNDVTDGWLPEQYHRAKEAASLDPVIQPLLELSWTLYNDSEEHKLTGRHKLTDQQLQDIARYILFLHSDLEYSWPCSPVLRVSLTDLLQGVLTLGYHFRRKRKQLGQRIQLMQQLGDYEYWPFFKKADYEAHLSKPPFLTGG